MFERLRTVRQWPLPYLIEAASPQYAPEVLFKPTAFQKRVVVQTPSVGDVGISLGGPLWDEAYEMHCALATTLQLPLESRIRPAEDDDSGEQFPLPDLFTHNAALIVSPRFVEVAAPFLRNFEVLPIRFESTLAGEDPMIIGGGETIEGYGWLRTWCRLDVIDRPRSKLYPLPPLAPTSPYLGTPVWIHSWTNMMLSPLPLGEHLFGLAGLMGGHRFFSIELYRAILNANLSVNFRPVFLDIADRANYSAADEARYFNAKRALSSGLSEVL
jgi:hypothetical protein